MDYFNGTAVLNTSGTVLERYAYSAFGIRRIMAADFTPRSSSSYAWEFGFQGQFRDSETGWYNYGYRFYVPLLGRWINRDPIAEAGGVNFYGFAFNSSLNLVDQYGLDSIALMTLRNPKRGSDGRVIKPFQNMGAPLLREYCGLICKFCDHSRGSPRRVIRETTPHPGTWPVLRPDGVDIPTCDPYTNEDTKESVSCEKAFGAGAIEIGTYHSHPSNSPFSKDDKGFARVRGKGNPIFKGTPDGEVEKFTPDLSTNPSQDNLFPGETSRVPTRN
jgi:RHS repeat-associated protein